MASDPAPASRVSSRVSRVSSLGRILRLARPELSNLLLGTLFLAVSSGAGLLFPQAIRYIVDRAAGEDRSLAALDRAALWLVGIAAVQAVAGSLRYALFTIA